MGLDLLRKSTKSIRGFTIVELLVVIVVIGILAAITVVSYTGITNRATAAMIQSDLNSASKQIELYKAQNDSYPDPDGTQEEQDFIASLPKGDGTNYNYELVGGSYYLTATDDSGTISYNVTDGGLISEGEYIRPVSFAIAWGSTSSEKNNSIINTSDGGYAVAGHTTSFGGLSNNAFIAKYSADGSLSWNKRWGGNMDDYAYSVTQSSDGGYVIAGATRSFGSGSIFDAFIAKFTSDGTLSWNKTWGGGSEEEIRSITQTSDGGYAVVGYTRSYGAGNSDAIIAKYTSDGTLSWVKTWGGSNNDYVYSITQSSDGGYAMVGHTYNYGAGGTDAYIAKFTSDGTLSWNKTWGGSGNDSANSIVQTSDGGYAVSGDTSSYGAGSTDAFIAKYTSDGTLSWSKTWGGGSSDYANSLIQTSDGGYVISGDTSSYGAGSADAFIAKYTSDGTLSWSKVWGGVSVEATAIGSLAQSSDGGYAISGQTLSYGAGAYDAFLIKYLSDGSVPGCSSPMCQSPSATVTSPSASVSSPSATVTSPSATVTSPSATIIVPSATITVIVPLQ